MGILQESAVSHDSECSVDQSPARQRIEKDAWTGDLFVTLADDCIEISNPESERLMLGSPRVNDFVLPMIVVFDMKDALRLVAGPVRYSFKHRRLECIKRGAGKDITAISHISYQLIPVS